jgi:hypothetical protein
MKNVEIHAVWNTRFDCGYFCCVPRVLVYALSGRVQSNFYSQCNLGRHGRVGLTLKRRIFPFKFLVLEHRIFLESCFKTSGRNDSSHTECICKCDIMVVVWCGKLFIVWMYCKLFVIIVVHKSLKKCRAWNVGELIFLRTCLYCRFFGCMSSEQLLVLCLLRNMFPVLLC